MVSNTTFSYAILSWFRDNGRALPWRDTTDPYPIWLSEVILQQKEVNLLLNAQKVEASG